MARTYRAMDRSSGKHVAFKHLLNTVTAEGKTRFIGEFRMLYSLHHPNIPEVYDLVTTGEDLFYTMELAEGRSLDTHFNGPLTQEWLDALLVQVLSALGYLHRQGIIHGDVKPANLIVTDGVIPGLKLIDFGLATLVGEPKALDGTIQYAAPEIIKKEPYDHRSDLYSLGVVLHELLTGINPFDDENVVQVVVHHLQKTVTDIRPAYPFVNEDLRRVVLKLLAKDPAYRYQDVGEIAEDLRWTGKDAFLHEGLYGRGEELATWHDWTSSGISRVITMQGAAGAGRSALLRQLKLDQQLGGRVAVAAEFHRSSGLSNIRRLLKRVGYEVPRSAHPSGYDVEWAWISGDADQWPTATDEHDLILRLVEWVFEVIRTSEALLFLLDNVDGGSETDRRFVSELARRWPRDASRGSVLGVVTGADLPNATTLTVDPFSSEKLPAVVRGLLNSTSLPDDLIEWTLQQTGGNALLIETALREAIHTDALTYVRQQWKWRHEHAPTFARSIRRINEARWQRLSAEERRLVQFISFANRTMKIAWLDRLMAGDPTLTTALPSLERAGLILRREDGFAIAQSDMGELALTYMSPDQVRTIHRQLAGIIGEATPEHEDSLAFHFARCDEPVLAVPYLLRAADHARKQRLHRESLRWLTEAASILASLGRESDLLAVLFQTEELLDRLGERDEQRHVIEKIAELVGKIGLPDDVARYHLRHANMLERTGSYDDAERACDRGLAVAREHAPRWTGPLCRLMGKTHYGRARFDEAHVWYSKALETAAAEGDPSLEMESWNSLGTVFGSLRDFANAEAAFKKALALAEKLEDTETRINGLFNLGLTAEKHGDPAKALDYYKSALPIIRSVHHKKALQKYVQYSALSQLSLRRFEAALDLYHEFHELSVELDDRPSAVRAKVKQALVMDRLGLFDQAVALMNSAAEESIHVANAQDTAIYRLYQAELSLHARQYATVMDPLLASLRHFAPESEWGIQCRHIMLECALETNFVLATEDDVQKLIGDADRWLERLDAFPPSLQIQGNSLLARIELWYNRSEKAVRLSNRAVQMLMSNPTFDQDPQEIWYYHYRILRLTGGARSDQANALQRAYDEIERIESELKKSAHRSAFMAVSIHRLIVTEHHELFAEEREADIRSFRQLYDMAQNINSTLDTDTLFERIMDDAIRHSQADRGLILLGTPDENELEIRVARNMDRESLEDISNISRSIVQEVFRTDRPVVTADANTDDRFRDRKSIVAFQIRSIMCVPLRVRDRLIGAVYLDKRFDTNYFGPHQLRFLESFANLAGLAIDNARLYEKISQEKHSLEKENVGLRTEVQGKYVLHNMVGQSKAMRAVYQLIEAAADNSATVLIEGESGTGKELVARAIHYNGRRRQKPFVAVDCGAMPENLLESELFGYKKGAFTGATHDKIGLFEEADTGTIFLDEITNTSLNFQARLLRVLQEGEIRRVGDNVTRKIDVRVIAATNRPLESMLQDGSFRSDLYYRLNVVPIRLPALRERPEDIPMLVEFLVQKHATPAGQTISAIGRDVMEALSRHTWPGNVRELENILQRMIVFSSSSELTVEDLPPELRPESGTTPRPVGRTMRFEPTATEPPPEQAESLEGLEQRLTAIETDFFRHVLEEVGGNKSKAAEKLGIKRTTLNDRLKKLGLQ